MFSLRGLRGTAKQALGRNVKMMNFEAVNQGDSMVGCSERLRSVDATEVLRELCVLLEEYSPSWYSDEQRSRVLAALRFPVEVLAELCALLEDYAPRWYTEAQHDRALAALRALGLLEEAMPTEPT
jgi:hypothetical protein